MTLAADYVDSGTMVNGLNTEDDYDVTEKSVPFSPVHEDSTIRRCPGQKGKDNDNVDNKSPQAKFSVACPLETLGELRDRRTLIEAARNPNRGPKSIEPFFEAGKSLK